MLPSSSLSRSVEDYLKAIYALSGDGASASTSAIAEHLDVQPASVSGMVKRLAEGGLAEHAPYRGVTLTAEGEREALRIIRRHRVLETYLHLRLGFSWDDVHGEAERLEHAASDDLIDRMATALQNPSHDPHGAPIPTRSGEIAATSSDALDSLSVGRAVRIVHVSDDDGERLRVMEAKGLLPGVQLEVVERSDDGDAIRVRVGGGQGTIETVSSELASQIFVG